MSNRMSYYHYLAQIRMKQLSHLDVKIWWFLYDQEDFEDE